MKKLLLLLTCILAFFGIYEHFCAQRALAGNTVTTRLLLPWVSGSDVAYASLLTVANTGVDPFTARATSGTCALDLFYNGVDYTGSLPSLAPGAQTTVQPSTVINSFPLQNSGQRGYLFITCNFPLAHAQLEFINPAGVVTFVPAYVVPPNRTALSGPEQLLR
jgi:hypothetical protein